jgi:hypothetical protein
MMIDESLIKIIKINVGNTAIDKQMNYVQDNLILENKKKNLESIKSKLETATNEQLKAVEKVLG